MCNWLTAKSTTHMSAYWPFYWREEDKERQMYTWKCTGLFLHWSPPNPWVRLCNAWFGAFIQNLSWLHIDIFMPIHLLLKTAYFSFLVGPLLAWMCCPRSAHLPQPLFSTVHFILTNLDTFHRHLVNVAAIADTLSIYDIYSHTLWSGLPSTMHTVSVKAPGDHQFNPTTTQDPVLFHLPPPLFHVDSIYAIFSTCAHFKVRPTHDCFSSSSWQ